MSNEAISRSATRVKGFNDPEMDFQLLRSFGAIPTGGGAVGECLTVAAHTEDGNPESWVKSWTAMADQLNKEAETCIDADHKISARDLFGRASMYYRAAEYYEDIESSRHRELGIKSRDAFQSACPLFDVPTEIIQVPFEPTPMPGYFIQAAAQAGPCKTLMILGGFDSSGEELYYQYGVEALKHGFNLLIFEGPGQTGMLRLNPDLAFRPDYEMPVRAAVDYALSRPEIDSRRLALIGISVGGYLAPRAAAHEPRIKALIADSPIINLWNYLGAFFPSEMTQAPDFTLEELRPAPAEEIPPVQKNMLIALFQRFGVTSFHGLIDTLKQYVITPEMLKNIRCPILACIGEGEGAEPKKQGESFAKQVKGPVTNHTFTVAWGADSHCQVNNIVRMGQILYDWLDDIFAKSK